MEHDRRDEPLARLSHHGPRQLRRPHRARRRRPPADRLARRAAERIYGQVNETLRGAVEAIGGRYLPNPRWSSRHLGNNLVTAHPLGGCASADHIDDGVVDHAGRVFAPGGGVYDGLHVCDGSVIPRALAVNPLLTISMFAERAADTLRRELGLPAYDEGAASEPTRARAPRGRPANGGTGPVEQRLIALRELAAVDRARAQDDLWAWMRELGNGRDSETLASLFALGTPPEDLDGPADGLLVTTLLNPLVDTPLRWLTKVWSPWHGQTFDADGDLVANRLAAITRVPAKLLSPLTGQLDDELVELAPDTHLGRILVRAPGVGPATIGYFALRQPAVEQ